MSSLIDIWINRIIFLVRAHMLKRFKRMLFIASAQKSIKKKNIVYLWIKLEFCAKIQNPILRKKLKCGD